MSAKAGFSSPYSDPSRISSGASKPIGALALIALGYRSLSLSPSAVGPVKALILDLDVEKAHKLLAPLIASPTGSVAVREQIEAFAAAEGLALGS